MKYSKISKILLKSNEEVLTDKILYSVTLIKPTPL